MTTTIIYHAGCPDGMTAAWITAQNRRELGEDFELVPANYGDEPPNASLGDDVIIVDYSYPPDELVSLANRVRSVTVLDHHQTAIETLEGLSHPRLTMVLDADRSGAGLAWDYFFGGSARPAWVNHVEDRDLWRFNLPLTAEVYAAITSYPYTLDAWDEIAAKPIKELAREGVAIERYRRRLADDACAGSALATIGGYLVPCTNSPYAVGSDVAGRLAEGEPFAAYYVDDNHRGERRWGLRSTPDGVDVARIAERYGGGGHRHAAGFTTPLDKIRLLP